MFTKNKNAVNDVYNIAYGTQTSLNELFNHLKNIAKSNLAAIHGPDRKGDVKHSLADISKAKNLIQYRPETSVEAGLQKTFEWYKKNIDWLQ